MSGPTTPSRSHDEEKHLLDTPHSPQQRNAEEPGAEASEDTYCAYHMREQRDCIEIHATSLTNRLPSPLLPGTDSPLLIFHHPHDARFASSRERHES